MAKLLEYNATLVAREDLEPTLAIFRLKPDTIERPNEGPWFVPGQYVTIGMNRVVVEGEDDPRPVSVRRPMSISSPPEDRDDLEFYIRKVGTPESDLPLTHVMWDIKVGERMYCRAAPIGHFTIPDTIGDEDRRLKLCVAAGTGMAPFISIVRSRIRRDPNARLDDIAIVHGASYPSSLGYRAECEALAKSNGLRYLPAVSRPTAEWPGWRGRAESIVEADRLAEFEAAIGLKEGELTPDNVAVLICGLTGTIANTITGLLGRGFIPDNKKLRRALEVDDARPAAVFWEQYDNTPVIDVKNAELVADLRRQLHGALAK
jgi:ferredoxin/flavodoxin---NADP+ reductase